MASDETKWASPRWKENMQQPAACDEPSDHLFEAATLSAQLIEAETARDALNAAYKSLGKSLGAEQSARVDMSRKRDAAVALATKAELAFAEAAHERDLARSREARYREALERINERAHHHPGCRRESDALKCSEYCAVGIARAALAAPVLPAEPYRAAPEPRDPVETILAVECPNVATHVGGETGVTCFDPLDTFGDVICASRIRASRIRAAATIEAPGGGRCGEHLRRDDAGGCVAKVGEHWRWFCSADCVVGGHRETKKPGGESDGND